MDIFRRRKNHSDVQQFLVRFANDQQSAANRVVHEQRRGTRSKTNLNVGIWVVPVVDGRPDCDSAFAALTGDVGWQGVGILADRPTTTEEIILAFPNDPTLTFLRVKVRACTPLGVGFYRLGTEATEVVQLEDYPQLEEVCLAAISG